LILAIGVGAGVFITQSPLYQNSTTAILPAASPTVTESHLATLTASVPTATQTPNFLEIPENNASPFPATGIPAPDFRLEKIHFQEAVSLSQWQGKPVLINFWTSLCPPCKAEAPLLEKLYTANREKGLVVLGVVPGNEDTQSGALAFAADHGLSYPLLWDDQDQVVRSYGVLGLPTSVLISPDGKIDQVIIGAVTADEVNTWLNLAFKSHP